MLSGPSFAAKNRADSICEIALASALFAAEEAPIISKSPAVQSYIALLQLYSQHNNHQIPDEITKAILQSKTFVNPFTQSKDSHSQQLKPAFEKLKKSFESSPKQQALWSEVKAAVNEFKKIKDNENSSRETTREKTKAVFRPKFIFHSPLRLDTSDSPSWQVIKNRVFIAVGSNDHHVYIFELDLNKNQIVLIDMKLGGDRFDTAPTWQIVGDRAFLATGSRDEKLYLFELDLKNNKLNELDKFDSKYAIYSPPVWQVLNDRVFVAFGHVGDTFLLELDLNANKLVLKDQLYHGINTTTLSLKSVQNRLLLIASTPHPDLELHEFDLESNRLTKFDIKNDEHFYVTENASNWTVINDRLFIAVPMVTNLKLVEFDLESREFIQHQEITTTTQFNTNIAWHTTDNHPLLSLSVSGSFHIYELDLKSNRLTEQFNKDMGDNNIFSYSWQTASDRSFMAVGSSNNTNFYLYEYDSVTGELIERFKRPVGTQNGPYKWISIHDIPYIIFQTTESQLYLFQVFK